MTNITNGWRAEVPGRWPPMSVGHQTFERNTEEEIARANAELEARDKRIAELELCYHSAAMSGGFADDERKRLMAEAERWESIVCGLEMQLIEAKREIERLERLVAAPNKSWRDYGWELVNLAEVGDKDRYRCTGCGKIEWFRDEYSFCACGKVDNG